VVLTVEVKLYVPVVIADEPSIVSESSGEEAVSEVTPENVMRYAPRYAVSFATKTLLKVIGVPSTVAVIVPPAGVVDELELFLHDVRISNAKIKL
jgi:hypothetical protein